jgi:hypothetical protein
MELPAVTDDMMRERLAQTKTYTLVLLKATARRKEPESAAIIWEHGRRNFALREAGLLPIVCPVTDDSGWSGLGIFDAPPNQVTEILEGDPGVRAGVFTFEVHPIRGFPGSALP